METDIYKRVGRRIREERARRGWTQEDLAERAQMNLSFVGQIERGERKPSLKTVQQVADAFGLRAGDLLDEPPARPATYPIEKRIAGLIRDRHPNQQESLYKTFRQLVRQVEKMSAGRGPARP